MYIMVLELNYLNWYCALKIICKITNLLSQASLHKLRKVGLEKGSVNSVVFIFLKFNISTF